MLYTNTLFKVVRRYGMEVNLYSILYLPVDFLAHGHSQGLVSLVDISFCFFREVCELSVDLVLKRYCFCKELMHEYLFGFLCD